MSTVSKGQLIHPSFGTGEIIESNGKIYSCSLNQTDIGANSNKFYIMQLIKNGSNYNFGVVYGRLGEKGKSSLTPYAFESSGCAAFAKQFKAKTGNVWGTDNFVKKAGKYFMSAVSYEDELKNVPDTASTTIPDSKLPEKVQKLISMLSDVNMMKNALVSLDIDTKKMPLGKIKQKQLDEAGAVLDKIQPLLKDINDKKGNVDDLKTQLVDLSSEYYTYLPMAFGRRKPPVINSDEMISKYRDTLDELRNIVVNVQITENVKSGDNPIDSMYKDINTTINPLDKNSQMWQEIEKYVKNSHGPTHGCKLEIQDIFEVEQHGRKQIFDDHCKNIGNRTLLYHGTPQSCVLSIFKNKYYLDPSKLNDPKIQIAGKLLGYGVYFADSCSKSINYCPANMTNDVGCLILNEIALGNQSTRNNPDYGINKDVLAKTNHHSAHGLGKWEPSSSTVVDGIQIPSGPLKDTGKGTYLKYNEFVVYDVDQILIKYLIIVKNNGNYNF